MIKTPRFWNQEKSIFLNLIAIGVFPEPPITAFPIQITGTSTETSVLIFKYKL